MSSPRRITVAGMPLRLQMILIAALVSTVALGASGLGFVWYEMEQARRMLTSHVELLASTIAHHSRAALAFDDREAAENTLRFLNSQMSVRRGCVLRESGEVFVCHRVDGVEDEAPELAAADLVERSIEWRPDAVVHIEPVRLGAEHLGAVYLESDLSEIARRREAMFMFAGAVLLFSLVGAIAFSAGLQRRVVEPISELVSAAGAVGGDSGYDVRVESRGPVEVRVLMDSFNEMVSQIDKRDRELVGEIGERRRIQAEREKLIRELERRNDEMERFNYTVSHDLKAPLVTIKGFLGLVSQDLERGELETARNDMQQIGKAAERMYDLLDDLLELSRIGRVIHEPETVPLREIALEALETLTRVVEEKGVRVDIAEGMPAVHVDRMRACELLQNLLENAIRFMGDQPEPRVELGARREGDRVIVHVRDNGIGIDPKYHETVFGLFDRLDTGAEGTGIGLALVRRIAEAHDGRVWVESEGAGQGCTFYVSLPAPPLATDTTPA